MDVPALLHNKEREGIDNMKKEQIYAVQAALSAAGAWVSGKLGILFPVMILFVSMMVLDQLSGMLASKREALDHPGDPNYGWSSMKWRKGIYKKFGYILTVMVAMVADYIIFTVAESIGIQIPATTMFGLLVTVWWILNESLSILENAKRMGARLPQFLVDVLTVARRKVELQGKVIESEEDEHER